MRSTVILGLLATRSPVPKKHSDCARSFSSPDLPAKQPPAVLNGERRRWMQLYWDEGLMASFGGGGDFLAEAVMTSQAFVPVTADLSGRSRVACFSGFFLSFSQALTIFFNMCSVKKLHTAMINSVIDVT